MSDRVKITGIIAGTAILIVSLYIYFSPFQTCVRAGREALEDVSNSAEYPDPRIWCAQHTK